MVSLPCAMGENPWLLPGQLLPWASSRGRSGIIRCSLQVLMSKISWGFSLLLLLLLVLEFLHWGEEGNPNLGLGIFSSSACEPQFTSFNVKKFSEVSPCYYYYYWRLSFCTGERRIIQIWNSEFLALVPVRPYSIFFQHLNLVEFKLFSFEPWVTDTGIFKSSCNRAGEGTSDQQWLKATSTWGECSPRAVPQTKPCLGSFKLFFPCKKQQAVAERCLCCVLLTPRCDSSGMFELENISLRFTVFPWNQQVWKITLPISGDSQRMTILISGVTSS